MPSEPLPGPGSADVGGDAHHDARHHHPIRDSLRFFGRFLKSPGSVGAVLPSSRFLARELVGPADLGSDDVVVEYGPGTGAITARIAEILPEGARFVGIELEPAFVRKLRARFPRLSFYEGSVVDVARILREHDVDRPRRIVSGLPFASLPAEVQTGVVRATAEVLAEGGEFRTFQYVHAWGLPTARRFRAMMDQHFASFERSRPVLRNVPPAYVLTYRR